MSQSGAILFEDKLAGGAKPGWREAPGRFVEHPEHGRLYLLESGDADSPIHEAWVGDESWRSYRIEVEMLAAGEGTGFLGIDFHAQDDSSACCNLHFNAFPENEEARFEGCARWGNLNTSWKLGPLSQRLASVPKGEWLRLRLDVGDTVANLHVNDAVEPVFTIYDLPFSSGGVRFWRYFASAYVRNLRVTSLGDGEVVPALEDVWEPAVGPGVVREWELSKVFPEGFGAGDPLGALRSEGMKWRPVEGDRRGVVNVIAIDPAEYDTRGVVFAKATVESAEATTRACRLTYTDRLSAWLNGNTVFDGEQRGWSDPGRSEADGWGRLMPDQFGAELKLVPGGNDMLLRLEVNEPQFGSGFWMRLE